MTHIVCMRKRKNIIVNEDLLEKTRTAMGERTFSGTIDKALEEAYRRHNSRQALRELQAEAATGDFFDREYVEQVFPDAARLIWPQRISADERRASRKTNRR